MEERKKEEKRPAARLTDAYVGLLGLGLPLFVRHGYFDITESKMICFWALSAVYLAAVCLLLLRSRAETGRGAGVGAWCMGGFVLIFAAASLLSGHGLAALLAGDNRYQGIMTMIFYLAVFLAVGRWGVGKWALRGALAGFGLAAALGAVNHLGWDPLGLAARLSDFDRGRYLSTVGNINFFGAYITLGLPALWAGSCLAEERWRRAVFAAVSVLGTWAALCAGESALLGTAAGLALLPVLLRRRDTALRCLPWLGVLLALSLQSFVLLDALCHGAGFSPLQRAALHPAVSAGLAALGVLSGLTLKKSAARATAARLYGWALAGLALAGLALLVLANTVPLRLPARWAEYLVLDGDWGTDRGRIWKSALALYREYPLWQKLLGGGAGVLARWDRLHRVFSDAVVDSAHNEYLHYLLTAGALGLAAYLGVLGCAARCAWRTRESAALALGCGAAAYAVQAAVNIAQGASTPLFFVVLALLCRAGAGVNARGT